MEKCSRCNKEIDTCVQPFTDCSKCKRLFCFDLHHTCFSDHNRGCGGTAMSLCNPSFTVNLVSKTIPRENTDANTS